MLRRTVINGKVMKTRTSETIKPSFSEADIVPDIDTAAKAVDKALLVSLGVDGDVPLTQARLNAGLVEAANDNDKRAAIAV